ncbi:MAG: glycoside hydrolase family 13 protein [Roseburia hominis]
MNESAILHIPDSQYCFAVGEKKLVIRLRMAKEDADASVTLIYAGKYQFQQSREQIPMEIRYTDRLYHYYETTLVLTDVRLAYVFCIRQQGTTYYFCEDGVVLQYDFAEGFYNFFQMPYINRNDVLPTVKWMKSAVFYQIFVDRFFCGNTKKDRSYINMEWGALPTPKSFAGGDLCGIIEKLDYLKELGITAIYLTPIFRSISNHKYDTMDYMQIDPQFGTKEEFGELVRMAHAHGIRIVLDAVFNHCSMQMQQFCDVMEKGAESPYYDWFLIDGAYPVPSRANYECFAECTYMPKLDTANPEVQEYLIGIACYWIREYGIDGWRLDVSDEVSHVFWRRFREAVKKEKADAVIIGENWHDAYPYLRGDQYDSITNYAFTKACLDYFARKTFDAKQMAEKLSSNLMRNMEPVNRMMLNLLDSHDTHRFYSEVGENPDRLLAALALEMVFPGAPCIYYGTEICTPGGYDPDSRRCFDWEKVHTDTDVRKKLTELTHIRSCTAITDGNVELAAENGMLCVRRKAGGEGVSLYINMTEEQRRQEHCLKADSKVLSAHRASVLPAAGDGKMTCGVCVEPEGYLIVREQREALD